MRSLVFKNNIYMAIIMLRDNLQSLAGLGLHKLWNCWVKCQATNFSAISIISKYVASLLIYYMFL